MANHRRLSTFCRALGASVIGLAGFIGNGRTGCCRRNR